VIWGPWTLEAGHWRLFLWFISTRKWTPEGVKCSTHIIVYLCGSAFSRLKLQLTSLYSKSAGSEASAANVLQFSTHGGVLCRLALAIRFPVSTAREGRGTRGFGLYNRPCRENMLTIGVEVVPVTALLTHFRVLPGESIGSIYIVHAQPERRSEHELDLGSEDGKQHACPPACRTTEDRCATAGGRATLPFFVAGLRYGRAEVGGGGGGDRRYHELSQHKPPCIKARPFPAPAASPAPALDPDPAAAPAPAPDPPFIHPSISIHPFIHPSIQNAVHYLPHLSRPRRHRRVGGAAAHVRNPAILHRPSTSPPSSPPVSPAPPANARSQYTCYPQNNNLLCPILGGRIYQPCGVACFDPSNYTCIGGELRPVGVCNGQVFDKNSVRFSSFRGASALAG